MPSVKWWWQQINFDHPDSLEWDLLVDISNGAIGKRLVEIVGVEPPEVLPAPPGHPYATPQDNVGSDIEQQYRAIDQARRLFA